MSDQPWLHLFRSSTLDFSTPDFCPSTHLSTSCCDEKGVSYLHPNPTLAPLTQVLNKKGRNNCIHQFQGPSSSCPQVSCWVVVLEERVRGLSFVAHCKYLRSIKIPCLIVNIYSSEVEHKTFILGRFDVLL